jgi:aminomethyltransferase
MSEVPLLQTPLNAAHRSMGAKMVDFGGWDMPVQYSGILAEHHAVRQQCGLFDVSHMGEIVVRGPEAMALVNHISTNDAAKLKPGQVHYSALLNENGCFVDDILVHKFSDEHFFLCVNASNQDKDFAHIVAHNRFNAKVTNEGPQWAQLAIQGPNALAVCQRLTTNDIAALKYYWFLEGEFAGVPAMIARTGYTGEDGFEVYVASADAGGVWNAILDAGREHGLLPCGLGARNTLRLEAKMALYGHEMDASITPWEAGLGWIVKMDKGDFVGRAALEKQKADGVRRQLAGFRMEGRGIGRDGYEISVNGQAAGWVTSGGPSPTLGLNIGLAMLPTEHTTPGTAIDILIRQQAVPALVVPTPFYKRAK